MHVHEHVAPDLFQDHQEQQICTGWFHELNQYREWLMHVVYSSN